MLLFYYLWWWHHSMPQQIAYTTNHREGLLLNNSFVSAVSVGYIFIGRFLQGEILSVWGDIISGGFAPRDTILLKKEVSMTTAKSRRSIVSHHFVQSPLDCNVGGRAEAEAGQNLVCGRRWDGSWICHENNYLIEKMVSVTTAKSRRFNVSHLFLQSLLDCNVGVREEMEAGRNLVCWLRYYGRALAMKIAI